MLLSTKKTVLYAEIISISYVKWITRYVYICNAFNMNKLFVLICCLSGYTQLCQLYCMFFYHNIICMIILSNHILYITLWDTRGLTDPLQSDVPETQSWS